MTISFRPRDGQKRHVMPIIPCCTKGTETPSFKAGRGITHMETCDHSGKSRFDNTFSYRYSDYPLPVNIPQTDCEQDNTKQGDNEEIDTYWQGMMPVYAAFQYIDTICQR